MTFNPDALRKEFADYCADVEPGIKAKAPKLNQLETLALIGMTLFQAAKELKAEKAELADRIAALESAAKATVLTYHEYESLLAFATRIEEAQEKPIEVSVHASALLRRLATAPAALAQPLEAQADELSLRAQYEDACIQANKNARDAERIAELECLLGELAKEFVRVFPIYYYAEPWAHDKNAVLKAAQAALSQKGEQG